MSIPSSRKTTRILRAEMDKLVTLPGTWLTLIASFILNLLLTAAFTSVGLQGAAEMGTQSILNTGLASMGYLQAGFIILGILAACSEYTGGQIRTTLTAIPWRGLQLSLKYLALAIITVPAAFLIIASGVLYTFIRMRDTTAGFEIETMISALLGATSYLTLTALLSAAIGAIVRRTTPALVILLGYYFVVSPLARNYLPWFRSFSLDTAGNDVTCILVLWTLVIFTVSIVFYRRRDA